MDSAGDFSSTDLPDPSSPHTPTAIAEWSRDAAPSKSSSTGLTRMPPSPSATSTPAGSPRDEVITGTAAENALLVVICWLFRATRRVGFPGTHACQSSSWRPGSVASRKSHTSVMNSRRALPCCIVDSPVAPATVRMVVAATSTSFSSDANSCSYSASAPATTPSELWDKPGSSCWSYWSFRLRSALALRALTSRPARTLNRSAQSTSTPLSSMRPSHSPPGKDSPPTGVPVMIEDCW